MTHALRAYASVNDKILDRIVLMSMAEDEADPSRSREWTQAEDQFLCDNFAFLTDAEIGARLGRSEVAVHIRWTRELLLPSRSKHPDVVTAQQAAGMLGVDQHKIAHWVDVGLIPGRLMPGARKIRLIDRQDFRRWVLNPMNWVYFKINRVHDPELKRMCARRAARWGNEWWTTRQVADYHGVVTKNVEAQIRRGQLRSFHLPVSLGGRDWNRKWFNHFVLKSDAMQATFLKGGGNHMPCKFTPAADRWLLKARDKLGMTFVHIGRTMKIGSEKCNKKTGTATSNPTIAYRYHQLKARAAKKRKTAKR